MHEKPTAKICVSLLPDEAEYEAEILRHKWIIKSVGCYPAVPGAAAVHERGESGGRDERGCLRGGKTKRETWRGRLCLMSHSIISALPEYISQMGHNYCLIHFYANVCMSWGVALYMVICLGTGDGENWRNTNSKLFWIHTTLLLTF